MIGCFAPAARIASTSDHSPIGGEGPAVEGLAVAGARRRAAAAAPAVPGQVEDQRPVAVVARVRLVEDVEDHRAVLLERPRDRAPEVVRAVVGHRALAVGDHARGPRPVQVEHHREVGLVQRRDPPAHRGAVARTPSRTVGSPSSPSQQSWFSGTPHRVDVPARDQRRAGRVGPDVLRRSPSWSSRSRRCRRTRSSASSRRGGRRSARCGVSTRWLPAPRAWARRPRRPGRRGTRAARREPESRGGQVASRAQGSHTRRP